jgi:signal transduction histidine kinase
VEGTQVMATVRDNGRGLGSAIPPASGGLGIASMEQRASSLGGTLSVRSNRNEPGVTVTAKIPFLPVDEETTEPELMRVTTL